MRGGKDATLHYNLACFYSLLGDVGEAKRRLSIACKESEKWRKAAVDDPDLKAVWSSFDP